MPLLYLRNKMRSKGVIKIRTKLLLIWQDCLDRLGMTDPWTQFAFTGILKIIGILAILIGIIVWSVKYLI